MSEQKRIINFNTFVIKKENQKENPEGGNSLLGGQNNDNSENTIENFSAESSTVESNSSSAESNSFSAESNSSPEDEELAKLVSEKDLEEEKEKLEIEKREHLAKQAKNKDYVEALGEYFREKQNYEKELYTIKSKIFKAESNKKKAQRLIAAIKPKCIYCKRPVGTLFSHKNNRYIAICGDARSPCNLNIEIFNGTGNNILYNYEIFREHIEELKEKIIRQKLNTLFNYVSEEQSIQSFKKQIDTFNSDSELYKEFMDLYKNLFDNSEKRQQLKEKNEQVFRLIEKSRNSLEDYKQSQTREHLHIAVEIVQKEIMPEIEKIRYLKNEVMEVNNMSLNPDVPEFHVFTYPVALSKIDDYNVGEPRRVIKFIR